MDRNVPGPRTGQFGEHVGLRHSGKALFLPAATGKDLVVVYHRQTVVIDRIGKVGQGLEIFPVAGRQDGGQLSLSVAVQGGPSGHALLFVDIRLKLVPL